MGCRGNLPGAGEESTPQFSLDSDRMTRQPPVMEIETIDLRFQGRVHAIAAYLVSGPGGRVLIETGPESTREILLGELAQRSIDPDRLDAVLVTHIHLDHSGAAWWFASRGVPVLVHPRGAKHLVDPGRLVESARMVYGDRFDDLWGETRSAPEENVRAVRDGERLDLGGLTIEVIESPGHAFHHHCFRIGDALFAGDAVGVRLPGEDYLSVTSAPPQFHRKETLATLDAIERLQVKTLYPTHFGEVDDPASHLAAYSEAVEVSTEFVCDRLAEGMDEGSLRVAYQAFQLERAFRSGLPRDLWETFTLVNGTDMCADGIRLYWERLEREGQ